MKNGKRDAPDAIARGPFSTAALTCSTCESITRIRISPASSTTPITCAISSAGRTDCLRLAGVDQSRLYREGEGLAFVVRRMEIDFRKPALMDDLVRVETRLVAVKGASLMMAQQLVRPPPGGRESVEHAEMLVRATVQVASMRAGRAARLPGALRGILAGLSPAIFRIRGTNNHRAGPCKFPTCLTCCPVAVSVRPRIPPRCGFPSSSGRTRMRTYLDFEKTRRRTRSQG